MATRTYSVLYTPAGQANTAPQRFQCQASSPTAARAQCLAAYPGCTILVVR